MNGEPALDGPVVVMDQDDVVVAYGTGESSSGASACQRIGGRVILAPSI